MSDDFLSQLEADAEGVDLSSAPSDRDASRLSKLGQELWEQDLLVRKLESELEHAKKERTRLAHKDLPALMEEIGQDRIGLPKAGEFGVDLVAEPYVHANISKDWDDERRLAAFNLLDRKGDGALIKNVMTFQFDRGDHEKVKAFLDVIDSDDFAELMRERLGDGVNDILPPPPALEMTVPWNTLTSYVKAQHSAGTLHESWMAEEDPPIDPLETLGATVGTVVKIKPRKG